MKYERLTLAFGVGLLSASVLLVELLLTRLFSVVLYYHFAFLAVSVALFGLGVGGLLVYLNRHWFAPEQFPRRLNQLGLALAATILVSLAVILYSRVPLSIGLGTVLRLMLIFLISSVPFVFAGAVLSLLVWHFAADIHRVYFYDLVGAALGSLSVLILLGLIGAPNAVLVAALLAAVSTALLGRVARAGTKLILRAVAMALGIAILLGLNHSGELLDLRYAKGQSTAEELYARWNAISRICVHPQGDYFSIRIDCDASTTIPKANLWSSDRAALVTEFSKTADDLPHVIRPGATTLVIGSGGGTDVARALAHGSRHVVAVEINPLIARDLMLGRLLTLSHRLYLHPEVELVVDDARSVIRRSGEQFQVIQATGIDTWASTAAGAFALTESYLYTVEAFQEYISHLAPDGILTVSRAEFQPPRQALRIASIGRAALETMGVASAADHFIIVQNVRPDVAVLIKRTPFTPQEIQIAREYIAARPGLLALYLPDAPTTNPFGELLRAPNLEEFAAAYHYDVSPARDAQPFFFFTTRWTSMLGMFSSEVVDLKNNLALFVLFVLLLFSVFAVLLLMMIPRWFRREDLSGPPSRSRWTYFLAIGVGYIIVEMTLIQSFILFMGHPTYGMTVVVFSLLVGSGMGSRWSQRFLSSIRVTRIVPFLLAAALAGASLFLFPELTHHFQGFSRLLRGMIAVAVVLPFGFVMGMPFPAGIHASSEQKDEALPWFWSANAAGSVLGSVCSVVLAISIGIPWTGVVGAMAYLLAGLAAMLTELPLVSVTGSTQMDADVA